MKKRLLSVVFLSVLLIMLLTQADTAKRLLSPRSTYAVGELTIDWGIGVGDVGPIFTVTDMAPGESEEREVDVTNGSSENRPVGIRLSDLNQTNDLSSVLMVTIMEGATTLYGPVSIEQFETESAGPEGIELSTLPPATSTTYKIIVTFDEDAGNEFQNETASFDLTFGIAIEVPATCEGINFGSADPIFGTSGNDTIRGTMKNDLIFSFEGNDKVDGGIGNDCIILGEGNDNGKGGIGKDVVLGEAGDDTIEGGTDRDMLEGGEGVDTVDGGTNNDIISGGVGNDKLVGGTGNDSLSGDGGNDALEGRTGNDTLDGGDDTDTANGGTGNDACNAETETRCEI